MDSRKAITDGDEVADQRSRHNVMKALESFIRLQQVFYALINEHNMPIEHGRKEQSSTISTDKKIYDSEASNTVWVNTEINNKPPVQCCCGFSDFVLGVKNARHQAHSRPDQGHQAAQSSLDAFRNSSRLKTNPHSAANSIT